MNARLPKKVAQLPLRVRLAAALEALPETDRRVLSLRLLEGLSAVETAGALNLRRADVERRTTMALESLSTELGIRTPMRRAA
jgi:DNA-directed RNA polymerase specialized sigma24 family protein